MPTLKKKRQQRIARGKAATAVVAKTPAKAKAVVAKRPVIYEEITTEICIGETAIDSDKAKELLGWEEETEQTPFGNKFLLTHNGKKIRCSNNVTNRPLYGAVIEVLKQELLRGRWRFNGEPVILGLTGLILNAQHCLISLVIAVDEWRENPAAYPLCPDEPTMAKLIICGVAEDDETVNTMDTCKPRSLMDVIYRASYFKDLPMKDQRIASNIAQNAVRKLWERAGDQAAHSLRRTHSEMVAFLDRHPKLLDAVRHIYEEDDGGKLAKYLSPGYSAAALYLMACSNTDAEAYHLSDNPREELLDMTRWDKACEFFVELVGQAAALKAVRDGMDKLLAAGVGTHAGRWAIIAKAWHPYSEGKPITAKHMTIITDLVEGEPHLVSVGGTASPLFGGIDIGDEGLDRPTPNDPTKEEIKKGMAKIQAKKNGKPKVAAKKGQTWAKGDTAWVHVKGEEVYFVKLSGDPYHCTDNIERVMVDAEEGEWEVAVLNLSLAQFEMK